MAKKFPDEIIVSWELYANERQQSLVIRKNIGEAAEIGEVKSFARYRRVETGTVEAKTVVTVEK